MNRWIVLALALLCVSQVWSLPTTSSRDEEQNDEADSDDGTQNDEIGDDGDSSRASEPPKFLSVPSEFNYKVGDTAYLPCLTANTGESSMQWIISGAEGPLFFGDTKTVSEKPERYELLNDYTLKITNLEAGETGLEVRCEILVAPGPMTLTHKIFVHSNGNQGIIISPGHHVDVMEGSDLELNCEVMPHVQPMYDSVKWSYGGAAQDAEKYTMGARLRIRNISWHQAGDYQCMVDKDHSPSPVIKHVFVKVKHTPSIEFEKDQINHHQHNSRDDFYTGIGATTNISCVIHSHPPIRHLDWVKDNNRVLIDAHHSKYNLTGHVHILEIRNVTKKDLGDYKCVGTNDVGRSESGVIGLKDTPGWPEWIHGEFVDNVLHHDWRVFSYKNITKVELKYRKKGEQQWTVSHDAKILSIGKEWSIRTSIAGIEPGNYEYLLRVTSDEGVDSNQYVKWGPESALKTFNLQDANSEAQSVKGSGMRSETNMMTLLLIFAPLMYVTCL